MILKTKVVISYPSILVINQTNLVAEMSPGHSNRSLLCLHFLSFALRGMGETVYLVSSDACHSGSGRN